MAADLVDNGLRGLTPTLSPGEERFILTYVENGGNARAAYLMSFGETDTPIARAYSLLARPEIAGRINELMNVLDMQHMLSLQGHMQELAEIRDTAKVQGSLKVALAAEVKRGEAAGLYVGKTGAAVVVHNNPPPSSPDRLSRLAERLVSLNQRPESVVDVQARVVEE